MATEDVITFCQMDLPSVSFSVLEDMRKREELCDLVIRLEKHSFTAHRVVLAAAIPYFRSMFLTSVGEKEGEELAVDDLDPTALESLISFAYSSKVSISNENAQSLLEASEFLQLYQVRDACVEFISERFRIDNVVQVRTFANNLGNCRLMESTYCFIKNNFEEISKSVDFLSLSHSCIKEIISEDDLNLSGEEVVFEAVMSWVKFSPTERQDMLPELLNEVRMVHLPKDFLIKRVARDELIRTLKPCTDLIDEVKNYHLLPNDDPVSTNLKIIPRKCISQRTLYAVGHSSDFKIIYAYYYDFGNKRWRILSRKTDCDRVRSAIAVREKIYMFCTHTTLTVHVKALEWETVGPTHARFSSGPVVILNEDKIYCFGSYNLDCARIRCFDTQRNIWLKEGRMKATGYGSAAASLGECIYVTGGSNQCYSTTDVVEKYNSATGQCSEAASMLTKRMCHGSTSMKGMIYVCGGSSGMCILNTAEVYDPLTNQWNFISPLKTARNLLSVVTCNAKIYALGGSSSGKLVQDFEEYDNKEDTWKFVSSVPEETMCFCSDSST